MIFIDSILKRVKGFGKEKTVKKHHSQKAAIHLLEDARISAFEILEQANKRAEDILSQTHLDKQLLAQEQIESLKKVSLEFTNNYQRALDEIKKEHIDMFKNISQDIEKDAMSEISDFKEIIKKESFASQKIVGKKIEEEYQDLEKQLKDYKEKKLAEINDSVYKILSLVSKQVLGKTLSFDQHEELIIKALEEAKAEGLFKN